MTASAIADLTPTLNHLRQLIATRAGHDPLPILGPQPPGLYL